MRRRAEPGRKRVRRCNAHRSWGAIISACREVRRMAPLSHHGGGQHGCGDQYSRQKFRLNRSISPLNVKSQQRLASRRKWRDDQRVKGRISSRRFAPARGWSQHLRDHLSDGFRVTESASLAGNVSLNSSSSRWSARRQSAQSSAGLVAEALVRAVALSSVGDRLSEVLICKDPEAASSPKTIQCPSANH